MSKNIDLKDVETWRNLNEKNCFNIFSYLLHNMRSVDSDVFFAFEKLFWPKLILFQDYVFLEEQYCKKGLLEIVKLIGRDDEVEANVNSVRIDAFFYSDIDCSARSNCFSNSLAEMWSAKLKMDFPDRKFIVIIEENLGTMTFCQIKFMKVEREYNDEGRVW